MKEISVTDILKAEESVRKDKIYGAEETLIDTYFNKFPLNTNLIEVAAKVAIIDTTNTTNLSRYKSKISLCNVAEIIVGIDNFDARVKSGDVKLVEEIARKSKEKYGINLFSFATKYCCYHNVHVYKRDDYSIYDNVVKKNLPDYCNNVTKNKIETWRTKIDYTSFNETIDKVLKDNKITIANRRRAFDHFLWYNNK